MWRARQVRRARPRKVHRGETRGAMMADKDLDQKTVHDLREGLALAKGWLELLFRHWNEIEDPRRREMIAGALFGANRVAFVLDLMEGRDPEEIQTPQDRMAEEFSRIGDNLMPA